MKHSQRKTKVPEAPQADTITIEFTVVGPALSILRSLGPITMQTPSGETIALSPNQLAEHVFKDFLRKNMRL